MAEQQSTSQAEKCVTVTVQTDETDAVLQQNVNTVRLKLKKPKSGKKVNWTEGTVDNEHLDKKKSKCCCIYKKPRAPEESSSEDDSDECEHCYGHVEKKKKTPADDSNSSTESNVPNSNNEDSDTEKLSPYNPNRT